MITSACMYTYTLAHIHIHAMQFSKNFIDNLANCTKQLEFI